MKGTMQASHLPEIGSLISKKILTISEMIKTVRVSDKGQIAIPTQIREALGIGKGDELVLVQDGGRLLIEKAQAAESMVKDDFRDILKLSERSLKPVWSNKKDEVWDRYSKCKPPKKR